MMSSLHLQRVAVFYIPAWSLSNWYGMACLVHVFEKSGMSPNTSMTCIEEERVLSGRYLVFRKLCRQYKFIINLIFIEVHLLIV